MTITTQFLSQCTDEQINKGIAWVEASKCETGTGDGNFDMRLTVSQEIESKAERSGLWVSPAATFLPCTDPSDIMPIAFANGIGVEPPESGANYNEWEAGSGLFIRENGVQNYKVYSEHLNPLRAICEVYILMSVSK